MSCSPMPCSEMTRGRRIRPFMSPTTRCTTTCGNIRRTNSSSLIVPSIATCAKWSTAILLPGRWRPGAALSRTPSPSFWTRLSEDKGRMDVMKDFATPLPVLVIAKMMGVPQEDRPYVRHLAEKLLHIGRGEAERMQPLVEGMQGMIEYVAPLVNERIDNPGDDFISVLAQGEKQGIFTRHQVLVNSSLLLLAGHETTINLLCNGTLAFMHHPDQWALLKTDPEGLAKRATEECLRYDAPVKSIQRLAAHDVDMRGKTLRKGDRIRWFITSANRDPETFAKPDTFDITRDPNPHVAFGNGVHHCLGATLARLEGQEAFKALAQRFPNIHLETEAFEYQPSITFRSVKSLPVAFN